MRRRRARPTLTMGAAEAGLDAGPDPVAAKAEELFGDASPEIVALTH